MFKDCINFTNSYLTASHALIYIKYCNALTLSNSVCEFVITTIKPYSGSLHCLFHNLHHPPAVSSSPVPSFSPSTLSLPLTTSEAERSHVSSAPKKSSSSSTSRELRVPVTSLTKKMSTLSTELREERDCPTSYSSELCVI